MDLPAPVASQPAPQGNGLNTLSSILGVQQQRQALQTGQYAQATAQAESQQAQQKNAELQAVGNLTKSAYTSGRYRAADGSFDNTKFAQDVNEVAPAYGGTIANEATSRAGEIYKNQQTLFNLESSKRKQLGETLGSLAGKQDVTQSDIINTLEGLRQQHPDDKGLSRLLQSTQGMIPPNLSGPQLQQALNTIASGMTAQPSVAGTTNAQSQIVNRGTYSGQLTPAGTPTTPAAGTDINPSSTKVAAATTTASGTAVDDNKRNQQISDSVAPSRQAILLTQQMDKYADMVRTGKYSQEIANAQAALGVNSPEAAARQLMGKTAAQLRTIAIANAPSDTARDTINAGFPDPDKMNADAIKGADEMIRGNMKMNLARSANAQRFQNAHGGTQGLRQADDQLTGTADGFMYEYQGLKPGPERQAFLQRHFSSRDEANAWVARKNLVEHNGGFQ